MGSGVPPALQCAASSLEPQTMDARITELEIKLAFAEDLLDGLNLTVYRQQEKIERLERELRQLRELMLANLPEDRLSPRDDIPPHY